MAEQPSRFKEWILSTGKTIFWFTTFCISIPIFFMSYLLLSISKNAWLFILTTKYPQLDVVRVNKIRNILDTHRNQGIIHVLLHIEGQCDVGIVKETLSKYVLERKNGGAPLYPKLRQTFAKSWGYYTWLNNESDFKIDNHVILGPSNYMGRPVNENNIQEHISGITSKYMPTELPQWQIVLIPSAGTGDNMSSDRYFMLVRMHHLILAEQPNLRLSDILLATSLPTTSIPLSDSMTTNLYEPTEPFGNYIPTIVHIPNLYNELALVICNKWNELLNSYSRFDGSNNLEANNQPGLFELAVLIFISFVTVIVDFSKNFSTVKDGVTKYFLHLCRREMDRRNLSLKCLIYSTIVSLHPKNVIEATLYFIFWVIVNWCILLPIMWYKEFVALLRFMMDPQQPTSSYSIKYGKLAYNAVGEILGLLHLILIAPRKIYEEIFESKAKDSYSLQSLSLCGRKVVSWSDKINVNDIAKITKVQKLTSNEVLFSASASALYTFLEEFRTTVPENMDTCARYVERDYFLENTDFSDDVTGYILVNIPLEPHSNNQIEKIRKSFNEVRENQFSLFLLYVAQRRYDILTKILPEFCIQLLFNYLSKKFTVSITKLANGNPRSIHNEVEEMLWKDKILDIIYFTPPQSNISVSLTIQQFGQHIRLAVMTDAIIRPFHNKISQTWSQYIHDMVH